MESMFLTSSLDGEPPEESHIELAGPRGLNRNTGHRWVRPPWPRVMGYIWGVTALITVALQSFLRMRQELC